jgi:dihydrofolate reductase
MIVLIAAVGNNNELGKNNDLLWHLPNDFKRFKDLTSGHYIIMGRKTFESLPKMLPNRTHIIITHNPKYTAPEGCLVVTSIKNAIELCPKNQDIYVIGGGKIYTQLVEYASKIELTRVHHDFVADTFFPEINSDSWKLAQSEFHPIDERHAFAFTFETYIKVG